MIMAIAAITISWRRQILNSPAGAALDCSSGESE
jgi:hypothetical protein